MALTTDFNFNPYYDDYDETKKYLRILFKPGFAVQARELTQMQTILQKQIERFGNHIFVNGSFVLGAKAFHSTPTYLKLDNEYDGELVNMEDFNDKTIYNVDDNKRADVVVSVPRDDAANEPPTLLVSQIYGDPFVEGETIKFVKDDITYFATIAQTGSSIGTGQAYNVEEGVFFYNGYFIYVEPQSIAVSKYDTTSASVRVGFQINEKFATYRDDPTLLDPALESTNYQSPGADRYYVDLVLALRPLTIEENEDNLTNFIELAQYKNGQIQNTKRPSVYNKIGDELAKRTFDESGNYVVTPFSVTAAANTANSALIDLTISPGKAYVKGYEIDMVYPTNISIEKARQTISDINPLTRFDRASANVVADYGDFYKTTNHANTFNINTLDPVNVYCVPRASLNLTSAAALNNTRIGSVRIKSVKYVGAGNVRDSNTYIYNTSLLGKFSTSTRNLVANVVSTKMSSKQIVFPQDFSDVDDAYAGNLFRIVTGPGSNDGARAIIDYKGKTRTATLGRALLETPTTSSLFKIEFTMGAAKCIANVSGTNILAAADISEEVGVRYRGLGRARFSRAINYRNRKPELIFNLGNNWIEPGSIKNVNYFYQTRFVDTLTTGYKVLNVSTPANERFRFVDEESELRNNYILACRSPGGSPYYRGQIIPSDKITITGSGNASINLSVTNGASMQFELIATVRTFPTAGNRTPGLRTKTLVKAQLNEIATEGGVDVIPNKVKTFRANGQIHIQANTVNKVPLKRQLLYLTDGKKLQKVLDFRGNTITTANMSTAVDVTGRYKFDRGARHSWYQFMNLKLKPTARPPKGPLAVFVDKFNHDSGTGYFTVDSYKDENGNQMYEDIPDHVTFAGNYYQLRDCIDFRRAWKEEQAQSNGNPIVNERFDEQNIAGTGPKFPKQGTNIQLSYEYYLPRVDKLHLSSVGKFEISKGTPSIKYEIPSDKDGAITLYEIRIPAYTIDVKEVEFKTIDNRRYTMQDIGRIDRRLRNLEYYTAMTMLESSAASKSDVSTIDRAKNGILTDAFVGFGVADTSNDDFTAGIDRRANELRTSTTIYGGLDLDLDEDSSVNIQRQGSLVFLRSNNSIVHAEQTLANRDISVNPYNVQSFFGIIQLSPKSDTWVDTKTLPDLVIQNPENENMRRFISASKDWAEPEWGSWKRLWFTDERNVSWQEKTDATNVEEGRNPGHRPGGGWFTNDTVYGNRFTEGQTRSGTLSYFTPDTVLQSQGESVVSTEIIPYMRAKDVKFRVKGLRPLTLVYPYFDKFAVSKYVKMHNYFTMNTSASLTYRARNGEPEDIQIKNGNQIVGNAKAVMISGNRLYVDNVNISISSVNWRSNNIFIVGKKSGANFKIVTSANAYVYYSGAVNVSATPTTTVFKLSSDANNALLQGAVIGATPVRIVKGTGAGESKILQAINYSTTPPTITVASPFSVVPTSNSIIQLGDIKTDISGSFSGTFHIPSGIYFAGKRSFRLTENEGGQWVGASTRATVPFFSQGVLQTVQEKIVATIVPRKIEEAITEDRVEVTTFEARRDVGTPYKIDPVAETFLVDPLDHPDGIFISKVRVCFKNKDDDLPVTLQIRPTVNGYPSATEVYPFGEVTLEPSDIKISDYPNLDDPASYTEFELEGPVHLQPGEHSVVLLSNSNSYRVFYARKGGGKDLRTNIPISSQPYTGSFFKSQNGQTWTAEQESDLMFRIYRHKFIERGTDGGLFQTQSLAYFKLNPEYVPTANANYDILILSTQDVNFANTGLFHAFVSYRASDTQATAFMPIIPGRDTLMDTRHGTRMFDVTRGANNIIVAAGMRTRNADISPIIDIDRYSITAIGQNINNLPISNGDIFITNEGSYQNAQNVIVTISGGGGFGARARANLVYNGSTNTIDDIYITEGGSGYKTSPTITITGGAPLINAVVEIVGEDKESGGNSICRYFTKKVELAEGFASGDLRVYLTAHKPADSSIDVYYKIHAAGDEADWEDRTWQLMTQIEKEDYFSPGFDDYAELTFAPGIGNVANNAVSYISDESGEFNEFTTFAVKVVMSGISTLDTPRVRDLRVVALPAV